MLPCACTAVHQLHSGVVSVFSNCCLYTRWEPDAHTPIRRRSRMWWCGWKAKISAGALITLRTGLPRSHFSNANRKHRPPVVGVSVRDCSTISLFAFGHRHTAHTRNHSNTRPDHLLPLHCWVCYHTPLATEHSYIETILSPVRTTKPLETTAPSSLGPAGSTARWRRKASMSPQAASLSPTALEEWQVTLGSLFGLLGSYRDPKAHQG